MTTFKFLLLPLTAAILCACAVGPDYVRPTLSLPQAYKENADWKTAEPQHVDASQWWRIYDDPELNALVAQADQANQSIRIAEAQYRRASAVVDAATANYFPTLGVALADSRGRSTSSNLQLVNSRSASASASWEPDLWGAIRRSVESGQAGAQASAADLAAARLTIQATVVQDYLQLRITDELKNLYAATLLSYEKSLRLTRSQLEAGVVTRADVALAETTLKSAQAQAIDLDVQRTQLEHALAILVGKTPAEFNLPPQPLQTKVPLMPSGLPSSLLERRPDIAGAERRVAAANASIGVAQAAYFPNLTLGAGATNPSIPTLLGSHPMIWSLGANLAATIFDGGARSAQTAQARASYDAAVAQYKQTVLNGFQEVEDNLAALRILQQESAAQNDALKAAQAAEQVTMSQYQAGTANFVSVTTAQNLRLSNERAAVQLLGRQLAASVALIKALGGGWNSAQLQQTPAMHTANSAN